jgi:hypothetical protein
MMRTQEELQTIVLGELRTHAECSNVTGVTFTRVYGEIWGVKTVNREGPWRKSSPEGTFRRTLPDG